MVVTKAFHASLPAEVRGICTPEWSTSCTPIAQKHTIEGLVMGAP